MIVITGANGHLGRRLLRDLCGRRALRAVVRSERAAEQVRALRLTPMPEICVVDYLDAGVMERTLRGASHVVHLAGIIKESRASSYSDAHENTARVLCVAAARADIRRIICVSILGSDLASGNRCLASKAAAEAILLEAATPALIIRVPMVLGEGDYASLALGRRAGRKWNVLLRANSYEQPIYAGDVIQALIAGISASGLDNVVVELAGPVSMTRAELVRRAAACRGRTTHILSLPLVLGQMLIHVLERLSANPPITTTMLGVLDHDDRIDPVPATRMLGIELTDIDTMLARCLGDRFG